MKLTKNYYCHFKISDIFDTIAIELSCSKLHRLNVFLINYELERSFQDRKYIEIFSAKKKQINRTWYAYLGHSIWQHNYIYISTYDHFLLYDPTPTHTCILFTAVTLTPTHMSPVDSVKTIKDIPFSWERHRTIYSFRFFG